jgi:N-acetylglucosamine kinase-like BadF-type ATPase
VRRAAVLAVDGGGSKLDAALLRRDGTILAAGRVPALAYDETGDDAFLEQIERAIAAACASAGIDADRLPVGEVGAFCLSGADLPVDDRRILRGIRGRGWVEEPILRNDTFAVLRAGTERDWGVGVVCGFGSNCTGVAPDGRTHRFAAVGPISGDFGGGSDLGAQALWFALRAEDGRGAPTSFRRVVPAHFGLKRPRQVMEALYLGRIDEVELSELAPTVFAEAAAGDAIALDLVHRQADEIVLMAGAAIRKLRMADLDPDVVLGGGIFRNGWHPFFERIEAGITEVAPRARVVRLTAPPIVGAAMLGLDQVGAGPAAHRRARAGLTHERMSPHTSRRSRRT